MIISSKFKALTIAYNIPIFNIVAINHLTHAVVEALPYAVSMAGSCPSDVMVPLGVRHDNMLEINNIIYHIVAIMT